MPSRFRVLLFSTSCALAWDAHANCGVAYCPAPSGSEGGGSAWAANLDSRFSNFNIAGERGSYLELIPAASYTRRNFHAMIHAPFVSLFADRNAQEPGNHFLALPYATYRLSFSPKFFLLGTTGMSTVLGEHHEAADSALLPAPVFVNPHGEREFQYRALADLTSQRHPGVSLIDAYWQGQIGLSHEEEGNHYGQAGLRARWPMSGGFAINGFSEFHPTSPQRYTWRMGLGFEILPTKWKPGHSGMETL